MTNEELIKALRLHYEVSVPCTECPYYGVFERSGACLYHLMIDSADALEAADKRIEQLEKQVAAHEKLTKSNSKITLLKHGRNCSMSSSFTTRVERKEKEPYTVIFKTDDAKKCEHIEFECRRMLGHLKPAEEAELETQIPKEGEWMVYPLNDFMGRRTGYHRIVCKCGYEKTLLHNNKLPRFCENCGSRMKGEQ